MRLCLHKEVRDDIIKAIVDRWVGITITAILTLASSGASWYLTAVSHESMAQAKQESINFDVAKAVQKTSIDSYRAGWQACSEMKRRNK